MEITYTRVGEYLLPDIVLSELPDAEPLTKYGMMMKMLSSGLLVCGNDTYLTQIM